MERTVLDQERGTATGCDADRIVFIGHHEGHTANDGTRLQTIEEQTEETIRNLKITLDRLGLSPDDLISMNVSLRTRKDLSGMHSVWQKSFINANFDRTEFITDFVDEQCLIQVNAVACRKRKQ